MNNNLVTLTEKAAEKTRQFFEKAGKGSAALRVKVISGGCSGMEYRFEPDTQPPQKGDTISESHGIKIYVESKSLLYMAGAEIDYATGLMNSGFRVNNPLSQAECSCGESFTV